MTPLDNGGPAFPLYAPGYNVDLEKLKGMTLLDYFAGQALSGIMTDWSGFVDDDPKPVAEYSYKFAAAMLEARKAYLK